MIYQAEAGPKLSNSLQRPEKMRLQKVRIAGAEDRKIKNNRSIVIIHHLLCSDKLMHPVNSYAQFRFRPLTATF